MSGLSWAAHADATWESLLCVSSAFLMRLHRDYLHWLSLLSGLSCYTRLQLGLCTILVMQIGKSTLLRCFPGRGVPLLASSCMCSSTCTPIDRARPRTSKSLILNVLSISWLLLQWKYSGVFSCMTALIRVV